MNKELSKSQLIVLNIDANSYFPPQMCIPLASQTFSVDVELLCPNLWIQIQNI